MLQRSISGRNEPRRSFNKNEPAAEFSSSSSINLGAYASSRRLQLKNAQKPEKKFADHGALLVGDEHLTTELSMLNDFSVKNLLKYEKHKNKEEGGACVRPTPPRDNPRRLILFFFCVFCL